ncbi:MAG: 50S ribosomal protein L19, partial [Clostridia bacterium]|nr:50S ribosomal protein L19 [Clostridia bacterium]
MNVRSIKEGRKMDKIQAFVNEQLKTEVPQFGIGDGVKVTIRIKEG